MKAERFDEIVERMAQDRVSKRIVMFRRAVGDAVRALLIDFPQYGIFDAIGKGEPIGEPGPNSDKSYVESNEAVRNVLAILVSPNPRKGWPSKLWEAERIRVKDDLLKQLDIVARAMLLPEPGPDVDRPQEPTDGKA